MGVVEATSWRWEREVAVHRVWTEVERVVERTGTGAMGMGMTGAMEMAKTAVEAARVAEMTSLLWCKCETRGDWQSQPVAV